MTINELTKELVKYPGHLKVEIDCIDEGLCDVDTVELEESPDGGDGVLTITTTWPT